MADKKPVLVSSRGLHVQVGIGSILGLWLMRMGR